MMKLQPTLSSAKVLLYLRVFATDLLYVSVGCVMTWPSPILTEMDYTETEASWIGALNSLGAALGPAALAPFMQKVPRKPLLVGVGCTFLVAWSVLASTAYFPVVCVGRLIGGAAMGVSFILIPVYLTEISDIEERQAVTTFVDFFLGLGFLVVYYGGPLLQYRVLQGVCAVLTLTFIACCCVLPESPVYLASRGSKQRAFHVLLKLRKSQSLAENEFKELEKYACENDGSEDDNLNLLTLLKRPGHTKALVLGILVMVLQQTNGITVFICLLELILKRMSLPVSPVMGAVIFGASNLPCIFISPLMARYLGTRLSLVVTSAIMAASMAVFTVYVWLDERGYDTSRYGFLPILALTIYNVFFCSGVGPLSWTMVAEMSPAKLKGFICFISTSACWLTSFVFLVSFQPAATALGYVQVYSFFAVSLIIGTAFYQFALPNTKGLSLQEIQEAMIGQRQPALTTPGLQLNSSPKDHLKSRIAGDAVGM